MKNFLFLNTEFFSFSFSFCFFFLHSTAIHLYFEQRGGTGRLNLDFFENY